MKKCLRSLPEFQPNISHKEQEKAEASQEEQKPQQAPGRFEPGGSHFLNSEGLVFRLSNSVLGLQ